MEIKEKGEKRSKMEAYQAEVKLKKKEKRVSCAARHGTDSTHTPLDKQKDENREKPSADEDLEGIHI